MKQLTKLRNLIQDNPEAVKCLDEFEEIIANKNEDYLALYEESISDYHLGIAVGLGITLNMEVNDDN